MAYDKRVRQYYNEAIALRKEINSELRHSLKNHPRMNTFIANMSAELVKVQNDRLLKGKPLIKDATIQGVVYDMVNMFIGGIEREADKRMQSEFAKYAELEAARYAKDLSDSADGKMSGVFKDIADEYDVKVTTERSEDLGTT